MDKSKGIYEIRNKITQNVYIGSTTTTFSNRWRQHMNLLKNNSHHSVYLQNSWNKYGEINFEFNILKTLNNSSKEEIIYMEQLYIDYFIKNNKKIYNCSLSAKGGNGFKHEYNIYKVDSLNGNIINKINNNSLINEYTPRQRYDIIKSITNTFDERYNKNTYYRCEGYYYVLCSNYEEWLNDYFNNKIFVCVYNLKGELLNYFFDMGDCINHYKFPRNTIGQCLTKNNSNPDILYQRHGFIFIRKPFINISNKIKTGIKFIEVYDLNGNFIEEFKEHVECAYKYNLSKQSLSRYANRESIYKDKNVIFKYRIY